MEDETTILYRDESYRILGACFEVYKEKGSGFNERVYHECLQIEFELQGIPAIHEPVLALEYKGRPLTQGFVPDFLCFGRIVLELKALTKLVEEHRAQVMNYLKATRMKLGVLANFGHTPKLEHLRVVAHDQWSASMSADLRA